VTAGASGPDLSPSTLRRLTVIVIALAVLPACGGRSTQPGRVADAAAPPRGAFEVYPDTEIAGLKSPHLYKGKALCQRCHLPDLKLTAEPIALCRACHAFGHGNHPVDVVQKTPAGTLPLLAGGKLACHTCHDPHRAKAALRMGFNPLCKECHRRH
jgi:predicted CXXCH cytochrome family protein